MHQTAYEIQGSGEVSIGRSSTAPVPATLLDRYLLAVEGGKKAVAEAVLNLIQKEELRKFELEKLRIEIDSASLFLINFYILWNDNILD